MWFLFCYIFLLYFKWFETHFYWVLPNFEWKKIFSALSVMQSKKKQQCNFGHIIMINLEVLHTLNSIDLFQAEFSHFVQSIAKFWIKEIFSALSVMQSEKTTAQLWPYYYDQCRSITYFEFCRPVSGWIQPFCAKFGPMICVRGQT